VALVDYSRQYLILKPQPRHGMIDPDMVLLILELFDLSRYLIDLSWRCLINPSSD